MYNALDTGRIIARDEANNAQDRKNIAEGPILGLIGFSGRMGSLLQREDTGNGRKAIL